MPKHKNKKVKKNVPHNKHDYVMKNLIGDAPQEFIDLFDLDYEFVEMLPTENVDLLERGFQMDCLMRVKHKNENDSRKTKLLNFEFQSTEATNEKIKIIATYSLLSDIKYGEEVETILVNKEKVKIGKMEKPVTESITFKYNNTSLNFIDARNILNTITDKINNNNELTSDEVLKLKLIPYENNNGKMEEYFKESCIITNKIKQDCLKEEIKQIQRFLTKALFKGKIMEELLMIIKEESLLYQDGLKEKEEELKPIIEEKNKIIKEQEQKEQQNKIKLEEKDKIIKEQEQQNKIKLEEKDKIIQELQKQLEKK